MSGRMSVTVLAAGLILAAASGHAGAQTPPKTPPAHRAAPSDATADDAMTDVDPAVVAQCKAEADHKRLSGAPRAEFMRSCVDPED